MSTTDFYHDQHQHYLPSNNNNNHHQTKMHTQQIAPASSSSALANGEVKTARELGIIEKLCSTYGFVYCCHRDGRYFFHFSEYKNDIHQAKIGDVVEFETTIDKRKKKPVAVNITPANPEIVGEHRVEGTIAVVARLQHPQPNGYHVHPLDFYLPDGKVTYVKKGETYFLPYGVSDLRESNVPVKVGDRVSFNVAQDRRTNQFFARKLIIEKPLSTAVVGPSASTSSTSSSLSSSGGGGKRYRGVISTMKDSFGFIEREDAVKEIFFHVSEFTSPIPANTVQPGVEVEFEVQDRHNKEVASSISILPKGTVVFDEVDTSPHLGRILHPFTKPKKMNEMLTGRLIYDSNDKKMVELPFGERDRCGLYTLLENDIVQFAIATDKRDGMVRATQIQLLDQSFLKSKEQRETGIVTQLEPKVGGQIKATANGQQITFRFSEVMRENFQIAERDLLEFTLVQPATGGEEQPQAIRIKLLSSKDSMSTNGIEQGELRLFGVVERDVSDGRPVLFERNGRFAEALSLSEAKINGAGDNGLNNNTTNGGMPPTPRQQEPGEIKYEHEGQTKTIQFFPASILNTSSLFWGDKVEFIMTPNAKLATSVTLIERNRIRGWIAIIREGKGFIEQNGTLTDNKEPVAFSVTSFKGDAAQPELGDEVEFSLRKSSGRLTAENILKVPLTINSFYSVLPTTYRGRVVSPVRMISNDECEILGRLQKITDDGIPGECYTFSMTGVKNKRVILLPNDPVTFSVGLGLDLTTRAVNIVLENEMRKAKVDTVKGQYGFLEFACEESKKIFFHNSEVDGGFELRSGDEVEFLAQYNSKSGKPCANKLKRLNNLQRPDRLITKLKTHNIDETTRQKLIIVRQPRSADEKSGKGFTTSRLERQPGVLLKT